MPFSSSAGGEDPIGGESFHDLGHDRSFDPGNARRGSGPPWFVPQQIAGADVDAAEESAAAIDHQNLFVVAQIEEGHAPGHEGMHEARGGNARAHAAGDKPVNRYSRCRHRRPDADLDLALLRSRPKRRDEVLAGGIGIKDIARQRDAGFRLVYRRQHRWIGFVAIAQQR